MTKDFDNFIDRRRARGNFFMFAAIALHLAIVLPLAFVLNIWMDEASTLYTTENGLSAAAHNVLADEKQAPLYFLVMSVWRAAGDSIFWARLFSILIACLSIKLFRDLARRFFDDGQAALVTFLFALHSFFIWTSLEIRVYSSVILLSILLLENFAAGFAFEDENRGGRARNIFTVTAIIALYTNYYLGFLLVACFAALLALRKFRAAGNYLLRMGIVGALFLPLVYFAGQQFAVNADGTVAPRSLGTGLRIVWNHVLTFLLPTEIYAPNEQTLVSFIRVWLVRAALVAVIALAAKDKFRILRDAKIQMLGAIAAAVAVFFLAAYFLTGSLYTELRHASVLFVPTILFVFAVLFKILPLRAVWVCAAAMLVFSAYSVGENYAALAKRGDWIRVARFIEVNEKSAQPILIFQTYDALSLPYYYRGQNKILPDENFFRWVARDAPADENLLREQIDFTISELPPDTEEFWLATEETCQNPNSSIVCRPLENFVEANYSVILEKDFYLEKIRLLRKKK